MPLTVTERINIIRRGIEAAQSDPYDLFGARMMVHDAFGSWGVNTNWVAGLLLPAKAPITSYHLDMLEMIANFLVQSPESWTARPAKMCEMVHLLLG